MYLRHRGREREPWHISDDEAFCFCFLKNGPWNFIHGVLVQFVEILSSILSGGSSDTVSFTTNSCEPDTPCPPKKITCTKTSINLRWNAPTDNGGHIKEYLLEFDEGKGTRSPFVECFKGRAKSFNLGKLQSQTLYRFRLCAVSVF